MASVPTITQWINGVDIEVRLSTVQRIHAARTIPIERYDAEGAFDRFKYLSLLADEHACDITDVIFMADTFGPAEDFDALVSALQNGEKPF